MNGTVEIVLLDLLQQNSPQLCRLDECIYCGSGEKPRIREWNWSDGQERQGRGSVTESRWEGGWGGGGLSWFAFHSLLRAECDAKSWVHWNEESQIRCWTFGQAWTRSLERGSTTLVSSRLGRLPRTTHRVPELSHRDTNTGISALPGHLRRQDSWTFFWWETSEKSHLLYIWQAQSVVGVLFKGCATPRVMPWPTLCWCILSLGSRCQLCVYSFPCSDIHCRAWHSNQIKELCFMRCWWRSFSMLLSRGEQTPRGAWRFIDSWRENFRFYTG